MIYFILATLQILGIITTTENVGLLFMVSLMEGGAELAVCGLLFGKM